MICVSSAPVSVIKTHDAPARSWLNSGEAVAGISGLWTVRFCAGRFSPASSIHRVIVQKEVSGRDRPGGENSNHPAVEISQDAAGQRSYIPGVGYIQVLAVDEVALAALTDADAQPDGFATADALRSEIESLYRDALAAGSLAFRIRFRVLDPREQAAAVADRESRRSQVSE